MPQPRPAPPKPDPEDEVQYAVARVLDELGLLWCHPPNEALQRGGLVYGGILVGLGVKTGVPDVLIFERPPRSPGACGVAIELKSRGGSASPDQRRWLAELAQRGWSCSVERGTEAALDWLRFLGWDVDSALARLAATGQVLEGDRMSRPPSAKKKRAASPRRSPVKGQESRL